LRKLFESLLMIKDLSELKLTLAILAHAAGSGELLCAVTLCELQSSTGLSSTSVTKGIKNMLARGYIVRHLVARNQPARYQVGWEKFGLTDPGNSLHPAEKPTATSQLTFSEGLKSYFTKTGFLDLLPMAADIANQLGYGEPEIIEAVSMVFDKQRTDPPIRNRSAWFATVFKEKLHEGHAIIARWREKQEYTAGKPVYPRIPQ